jgi:hypothetical protein
MSDDRESGTLPQDERRDMPGEGGETAPTGPEQPWISDGPHSRSTFSLRVQPDRRRSSIPIDSARERRRR